MQKRAVEYVIGDRLSVIGGVFNSVSFTKAQRHEGIQFDRITIPLLRVFRALRIKINQVLTQRPQDPKKEEGI